MVQAQSLPWVSPLEMAACLDDPYWALLHSSAQTGYSGRYSILACTLDKHICGDSFNTLEAELSGQKSCWENAWFGYFGYGLKNSLEPRLPPEPPAYIPLPDLQWMHFKRLYLFDHERQQLSYYSQLQPLAIRPHSLAPLPQVASLSSSLTDKQYREAALSLLAAIRKGDIYQANLTRKFFGAFTAAPEPLAMFNRLCSVSPAPYAALLRMGDASLISSSPELFLKVENGVAHMRPIKGTARRGADAAQDALQKHMLENSEKDRAENLMITDLVRNDLARNCVPGSVKTSGLFEVTSHAQVHHMASSVKGSLMPGKNALDAVRGCFPPGSMTGAPKIAAIEHCSALEPIARGPYSGALGWFGGNGDCELSVIIRTLILQGDRFEFQVGGGIVADSTPEGEYAETLDKASGIIKTLGISATQMRF